MIKKFLLVSSLFFVAAPAFAQTLSSGSLATGCFRGSVISSETVNGSASTPRHLRRTVCIRARTDGYLASHPSGYSYLLKYSPRIAGVKGGFFEGPAIGVAVDPAVASVCTLSVRLKINPAPGGIHYQQSIVQGCADADPFHSVTVVQGTLKGIGRSH